MASRRVPGRTPWRRFTLGSGPLRRTSDRVEFLSRVALALALLLAIPLGLLSGAIAYTGVATTADRQAATRSLETATLLAEASADWSGADTVSTPATWTAPDGGVRTGKVDAPLGALVGSTVDIWVDEAGRVTWHPLTDAEVTGQGVVVGVLTAFSVVVAGMGAHLVVVWLLERRRHRRWETGWAAVEPLWVSRFR